MSERSLDLLVLGDVNPDLILSAPGLSPAFDQIETLVDAAELAIGGSGSIMACAAARLGLRTAIAGVVGDDLFGRYMIEQLAARGVDTSGLIVDPAVRTGLTAILARDRGDRAILTFPGAIGALRADAVEPGLLARARHVHVSSYYLQSGLVPGLGALLRTARRTGATTSIDPNWDPAQRWDAGLRALLGEVDVLMPNAVEAQRIGGVADTERAARELAAHGPLVVVKLGREGALAVDSGGATLRASAPPGIDPVDTVGAGDTFDAGLLAGRLGGEALPRALALACACGSLSTRAAGGTAAQPTLAQARAAATEAAAA